jgi:hypothetical protein
VLQRSEDWPIATLLHPVVFDLKESVPIAMFSVPPVFEYSAWLPKATLLHPVVLQRSEL